MKSTGAVGLRRVVMMVTSSLPSFGKQEKQEGGKKVSFWSSSYGYAARVSVVPPTAASTLLLFPSAGRAAAVGKLRCGLVLCTRHARSDAVPNSFYYTVFPQYSLLVLIFLLAELIRYRFLSGSIYLGFICESFPFDKYTKPIYGCVCVHIDINAWVGTGRHCVVTSKVTYLS